MAELTIRPEEIRDALGKFVESYNPESSEKTEVGKVAHVAQALSDLDGVKVAEDITGPYDIIAKIQAPGLDQLGRLVVSRIQVVDGVTRTLTCTVIRR